MPLCQPLLSAAPAAAATSSNLHCHINMHCHNHDSAQTGMAILSHTKTNCHRTVEKYSVLSIQEYGTAAGTVYTAHMRRLCLLPGEVDCHPHFHIFSQISCPTFTMLGSFGIFVKHIKYINYIKGISIFHPTRHY